MSVLNVLCFLCLIGTIGTAYAEVCAGCPVTKSTNDPEGLQILTKVVNLQNAKKNGEELDVPSVKILKLTSQVVAGTKYDIAFNAVSKGSKKQNKCHTQILLQPWIDPEPQVLSYNCEPSNNRRKRSI